MPDISSITHYPLKIIFAVHLILTTWGIQGHWCPQSAMFYNLLFFGCLLWAINNIESDEPLQFALIINILSILFDVVTLAIYFQDHYASERFSGAIMIINLLVRLISSKYLLKIGRARNGSLATLFPPGPDFERQHYEDISHSVPQNDDFSGI
ncbi:hypothetical protein PV327_008930 [Microctonus hyperodae]|uniref:Type-1 angiotensin II receptor-associated protein n=1 Tax=Microctonus hyperodae TaxID=165561 RepID=A0AA39FSQ8_MICHY|nr:hypothetical protein PV327_008930 [Microctonus hyperodae]